MMVILLTVVLSNQSGPIGQDIRGAKVYVPMKHGSCGQNCRTHVLATKTGSLGVRYTMGMSCSRNRAVNYLGYQIQGQRYHVLINRNTGRRKYAVQRIIRPFSAREIAQTCRRALGGDWSARGYHNAKRKIVRASIKKYLRVYGGCTGKQRKGKNYSIRLNLICDDKHYRGR